MKRLQTLQFLLEREQGQRDEAQAHLRVMLGTEQAARTQSDALTNYRIEYRQRWTAQFAQQGQMEIVRCYHGFIARLDMAIEQQQGVVLTARQGVEAARARLLEREVRVATVERLIARRRQLLARVQEQRDQKNLDEMAQRRSPPTELRRYGLNNVEA